MRGVVFDLDGTLVDSLGDIARALNASLAATGHRTLSEAEVAECVGDGAAALVQRAVPDGAAWEPVLAELKVRYGERPVVTTRAYAGIVELLAELRARDVGLAVLSNKPQALTEAVVAELFEPDTFAEVVGQRDGVPKKPDPAEALRLAAVLGVAPEACAMVGDSLVDIETGLAAGMRTIAVTWGFRPRAHLQPAGAHALVDDVTALRRELLGQG